MLPVLLPARRMAQYLQEQNPNCAISESFLRQLVRDGSIGFVKCGRRLLLSADEIEAYIMKQLES